MQKDKLRTGRQRIVAILFSWVLFFGFLLLPIITIFGIIPKVEAMIVITGAAGFIGSCLAGFLNRQGISAIIGVDRFRHPDKKANLDGKEVAEKVEREIFHDWLDQHHDKVEFIFHLGARTDTSESNAEIFQRLNTDYSKKLWQQCSRYNIPFLYAS